MARIGFRSGKATVTRVSGSATSVNLLPANTKRIGALFFNESTATLYLKFGATATVTSYTVQVGPGQYYEIPTNSMYTGAIDGIWGSAAGAVQITELA